MSYKGMMLPSVRLAISLHQISSNRHLRGIRYVVIDAV